MTSSAPHVGVSAPVRPLDPTLELRAALLVESVSDRAWRVCDGRREPGEGRFIAFIEQKGDAFEVMQLAADFVWTAFPTMQAALDHVIRTGGDNPSPRPGDRFL